MIEGFYMVMFNPPNKKTHGGGVLVLSGGNLYGGDTSFHYQGTYRNGDEGLEIDILAKRFNDCGKSAFGKGDQTDLRLRGSFDGKRFDLTGSLTVADKIEQVEATGFLITKLS